MFIYDNAEKYTDKQVAYRHLVAIRGHSYFHDTAQAPRTCKKMALMAAKNPFR